MNLAVELAERAVLPDWAIRAGVRSLLRSRLRQEERTSEGRFDEANRRLADRLRQGPIAIRTTAANEQHYEVPAEFFDLVLGKWNKYSSAYWPQGVSDLDGAEESMLSLTCDRAGIEDGMRVLDLGCGWGSLTLWIASRFPGCRVRSLSNSNGQRQFIEARCRRLGLDNVSVTTGNVSEWDTHERFDRVVSIEMFEHVRNHEELLAKVARWLDVDARLFVHIFCHARHAYTFEEAADSWIGSEFFSGGIMPHEHHLDLFPRDLRVARQWRVNGVHYARTLEAWLERLDEERERAREILGRTYGRREAVRRLQKWRLFFLGLAEAFAYGGGEEWFVTHCLLEPS